MVDIYYENGYDIDRTYGMKKVIKYLENKNINLRKLSCVDMFAVDGTFCTTLLAEKVHYIDCFEIDKDVYTKLKDTFSSISSIRRLMQKDSIEYFNNNQGDYDLIFIDNPQGKYSNYFEYFDILPIIKNMMNEETILIHNPKRILTFS